MMRDSDLPIRFRVAAEFLGCHSTRPQSLSVNEPAALTHAPKSPWTSPRESHIGGWAAVNLPAKASTRRVEETAFRRGKKETPQTTHSVRDEHRITAARPGTTPHAPNSTTGSGRNRLHDNPQQNAPPKEGERGRSRSTCPLDFGLPIGGIQRDVRHALSLRVVAPVPRLAESDVITVLPQPGQLVAVAVHCARTDDDGDSCCFVELGDGTESITRPASC